MQIVQASLAHLKLNGNCTCAILIQSWNRRQER
jgi:hypothetical protein